MNVQAFVKGYRAGRTGSDPILPPEMTEHEIEDLSRHPSSAAATKDHDWAWHLIGWTAWQVARLRERPL